MAFSVAWRILTYQKGRTALAVGGIFVAILLIFVELGFFIAVPQGGLLIYDHMRFDLLVTSNRYVYQTESGTFARDRLAQVRANPDVAWASAVYIGGTKWQDPDGGQRIDASVIGFDPDYSIFTVPDILAQSDVLERPDTVLVDRQTRSIFGPLDTGRVVDLNGHQGHDRRALHARHRVSRAWPSCWRARIRFSGFSAPARARDRAIRSISGSSR